MHAIYWKWDTARVVGSSSQKVDYIKIATELNYGPECIEKLKKAGTDIESERILKTYRLKSMED